MTGAAALLRRAGIRPTRQRLEIVRALETQERPATAQMLHRRLRGTGRPGLATVYRTLRALGDSGLAQTFAGDGEVAYRLCSPAHHHHLTCERCGSVEEIPSCEVEAWAETVSRRRGFVLTAHTTDLVGVCGRCRASLSPPSSRSRKT